MRSLRRASLVATMVLAVAACGDDAGSSGGGEGGQGVGAGLSTTAPATGTDATSGGDGAAGPGGPDASSATGTPSSTGPGAGGGEGGAPPLPDPTCPDPDLDVDTSAPDAVVGDGTATSCDEAALDAALATGGIVTFACGDAPVTITVTSEKAITSDTVIDGGGRVTLSGGGTTRILHLASAWDQVGPKLVVQDLGFEDGFIEDVPNTSEVDKGGGAIFRDGGSLDVVRCSFSHNTSATSGQDVSGGAITSQGVGDTRIVGSAFFDNTSSNGGAVGNLGNGLTVVNSIFEQNAATGTDGNPGNGGNGGAIVFDGADTVMSICGSQFLGNTAGAQGGAVFRVSYTDEQSIIDRCSFTGNAADPAVGLAGALYLEHTTIAMTATTIASNSAHYGGGIWIGNQAIAAITNVTIADNEADQGGGVWIAGGVTGTILNATIARNRIRDGGYANGVFGDGSGLAMVNTIFLENGCEDAPLGSGGTNIEFPENGGSACTTSSTIADPMLGQLADNGGPTMTLLPAAGSDAIGLGTGCPDTDQRGEPRGEPCTLGAVEVAP